MSEFNPQYLKDDAMLTVRERAIANDGVIEIGRVVSTAAMDTTLDENGPRL